MTSLSTKEAMDVLEALRKKELGNWTEMDMDLFRQAQDTLCIGGAAA